MKKILTTIALALIASLATAQTGVTFVVDENLSPVEDDAIVKYQNSGAQALNGIFHDEGVPGDTHAMIAWSFADDEKFYTFTGKDVFFKTIVRAYAEHRPLVLSPDMIWVLVSQGFARYVNAHPEQLRDQLVNHSGKMDLVVQSDKDLLSGDADWEKMMADFAAQINENAKGDIAKTITADFTTTGITERITSQITLMETMKSYFDNVVHYLACGIPSITLTGTPEDWQKVLEKTKRLENYGVGPWTQSLVPLLTEFVKASEGKADQAFWQDMVKKGKVDKLGDGKCIPGEPTKLDGWILKFFPDENGLTLDQVPHTHKMPSERVYVDFKYKVISPADGKVLTDIPLQLVAGFIGTEVDTLTHALTPKMGWVVRQMEGSDSIVKRLERMDSENSLFGIELRVNKVPEHLSQLPHIKRLTLYFTDKVELPDWFYRLQIDNLRIDGEMTDEQEAAIWEIFPNAILNSKGVASRSDMPTVPSVEQILQRQGLSTLPIPTREVTKAKKANKKRVKAGKKISGVVSDEFGPLFGASVCEIDDKGRIVESAITDVKGHFTMRIKNPQDRLRFSYVGMITVIHAINRTKYKIVMQSATQIKDVRVMPRRSSTDNGLLIPLQEMENATKYIDMSEFEGLNIEPEGSGVSNENNPRVHINLTDEEQTLVTSVNDLGFNMFRKVGTNESILLSPLGMTYALGLINNGAGGKTRTQISKVLGCNDTGADKINGFCRKMLTEAPRIDKLTTMEITNEFFSPISYKLKPAFKEVAIDKYDTQFKNMESDQLKYTLVNTIYFKSVWTDKFRKANTRDEVFRGEDGKVKTVPMMNQIHKYFYTENDLCQTLCLPYSNGAYQMIVLLPKEGKTVQEVAQSLMADSWKKMYDQMRRVDVDVKLPRFESSSEVNLTRIMSALGMPDAFSMEKADFRNLFDLQSCIGMIKQLGRIKVDETGTEATVATILQGRIAGLNIVQPDIILFHATHPFLYFVRVWSTGTIFFIGQYMGTSN